MTLGDRTITFWTRRATKRSRPALAGAQGADIAVLVVAADDGVMPPRGALAHARAARVPIVSAQQDRPAQR